MKKNKSPVIQALKRLRASALKGSNFIYDRLKIKFDYEFIEEYILAKENKDE